MLPLCISACSFHERYLTLNNDLLKIWEKDRARVDDTSSVFMNDINIKGTKALDVLGTMYSLYRTHFTSCKRVFQMTMLQSYFTSSDLHAFYNTRIWPKMKYNSESIF